jgi:hypothetical protein
MLRKWILSGVALVLLAIAAGGCFKGGGGAPLKPDEMNALALRIRALGPIAAVHKGKARHRSATSSVLNEFVAVLGHTVRTVNRTSLQQLLDTRALHGTDLFGAGGGFVQESKKLVKERALLVHEVEVVDENAYTAKTEHKWVITGRIRICDLEKGEWFYASRPVKGGGKKTINESIDRYAHEMYKQMREDFKR